MVRTTLTMGNGLVGFGSDAHDGLELAVDRRGASCYM